MNLCSLQPPPPSMLKDSQRRKVGVGTDSKKHVRLQVDPREEEMISQLTELSLNKGSLRSGTGMVYDPVMAEPKCLWDSDTPESPERVTTIMEKLKQYGLLDRCHMVKSRSASREELLLVHTPDYIDLMKSMESMNIDELKTQSEAFDLVYFHP
ncbi:histone deacetylase 6-like, partial [Chiloscyllium punctatum]|uniref:histone deacetylase 6-like n=1 Tax=Chiloscyllium punctatum TaxID=137246 RepID=UPI003B63DE5B